MKPRLSEPLRVLVDQSIDFARDRLEFHHIGIGYALAGSGGDSREIGCQLAKRVQAIPHLPENTGDKAGTQKGHDRDEPHQCPTGGRNERRARCRNCNVDGFFADDCLGRP